MLPPGCRWKGVERIPLALHAPENPALPPLRKGGKETGGSYSFPPLRRGTLGPVEARARLVAQSGVQRNRQAFWTGTFDRASFLVLAPRPAVPVPATLVAVIPDRRVRPSSGLRDGANERERWLRSMVVKTPRMDPDRPASPRHSISNGSNRDPRKALRRLVGLASASPQRCPYLMTGGRSRVRDKKNVSFSGEPAQRARSRPSGRRGRPRRRARSEAVKSLEYGVRSAECGDLCPGVPSIESESGIRTPESIPPESLSRSFPVPGGRGRGDGPIRPDLAG
jgi:hypothetical protein